MGNHGVGAAAHDGAGKSAAQHSPGQADGLGGGGTGRGEEVAAGVEMPFRGQPSHVGGQLVVGAVAEHPFRELRSGFDETFDVEVIHATADVEHQLVGPVTLRESGPVGKLPERPLQEEKLPVHAGRRPDHLPVVADFAGGGVLIALRAEVLDVVHAGRPGAKGLQALLETASQRAACAKTSNYDCHGIRV